MRPHNHSVSLAESECRVIDSTNAGGALHDGIEHRLHVGRRAADNTEHLRRRRLMLQGLPQFCVALLDLLEQSDILDSDDSLIHKGFEQFNLRRSEGAYLDATGTQRSNYFPLLSNGNKQKGAGAASDTQPWKIVLHGSGVGNVERAVLAHPTIPWLINTDLDAARWLHGYRTKMSPSNQSVPLVQA